jgi:hypothetical protein
MSLPQYIFMATTSCFSFVCDCKRRQTRHNLLLIVMQMIGAMFALTLLLPARYLAKLTYFIVGFMFWHVTPVVMAMSPATRAR